MAATPGYFTTWPWKRLGNFKYMILAPPVMKSIYDYMTLDASDRDVSNMLILPLLLTRMIQNQIWTSISRYITAKGKYRIYDKPIEFDQIDHESGWDDQIILNGILLYAGNYFIKGTKRLPFWRLDGVIIVMLLHVGVVEFLYYWIHRSFHHHFLYNRYHSHHHSSIVLEPITSVNHPFAEHLVYFSLFFIPVVAVFWTKTASIAALALYTIYIDLMNYIGHFNVEFIPEKVFSMFPPLKYFMYTPTFHALHHTRFRTNYSLFVPLYDYVYGTVDIDTDTLREKSLNREEDSPDMVFLTHLTTPESIYHMRLGFPSLASKPHTYCEWYLWMLWPVTIFSMMVVWIYGKTSLVVERNVFKTLKMQSWVIPKYRIMYSMETQRETINGIIEEALVEANAKGAKVLSLGLLNQELNGNGEMYIRKNPTLKVKLVDGSSLAVAVILNSIPKSTTEVALRGNFNKVAYFLAIALCRRGIQVATSRENDYLKLKSELELTNDHEKVVLSRTHSHQKTWLAGDGLSKEEQLNASKGTLIIPYSQFPPKKVRKDCFYYITPAMLTPKSLENVDSCENWLPRRVMSAWRIAGILHALEGWNVNEYGTEMFNIDKVWEASLLHGFTPLANSYA